MIDFILEHWDTFFAIVGITGTTCTAIVAAFSKCKWLSVIVKLCDWISVANTAENKAILKDHKEKAKKNDVA